MERRKEINGRLVRWIAEKAEREYAEDISLVLIYGSYVNGTANSRSDVDCCFIPKTERGYEMAAGFILEGVGYDIFPMSWERVERIACLRENLTPLVGDAEIIFCGSAEDMARFQGMQEKLQCCLADGAYVREIAEERCREAGRLCGMLERVRTETEAWKLAGMVIMTLADAVAVFHHRYFHFGLKRQFEDLMKIQEVPEEIVEGYRSVVKAASGSEAAACARKMLADVCRHLWVAVPVQAAMEDARPGGGAIDGMQLAGLYEEISSTFNKIYVCCEAGNAVLAFLSAVCLQRELDEVGEYDLLEAYDHRALDRLAEAARRIEAEFVGLIEESGGRIRRYGSFEEFAAHRGC